MFRILSLTVLVLVLSACNNDLRPADTSKLVESELELSGTSLSLYLPTEATIKTITDSALVIIEFQPETRSPLSISFNQQNTTSNNTKYSRQLELANGANLNYDLTANSVGSGGSEAFLKGEILFEDAIIEVDCHIQKELGKLDATWCVPYLHHLNIIPKG